MSNFGSTSLESQNASSNVLSDNRSVVSSAPDTIFPQEAFHDLSSRTSTFRNKLIEEFQIFDLIGADFSSTDVKDPKVLKQILGANPYQLIKFNVFRRQNNASKNIDRRFTRIKNQGTVPLGAWAGWLIRQNSFQNIIMFVIVANSVIAAFAAEYTGHEADHWELYQGVRILDYISFAIFVIEIILKCLEDFEAYMANAWDVFDFLVTIVSGSPVLLELVIPTSHNISGLSRSIQQLRMLRILRVLKLVVRFGSLKIIIMTILEAFRSFALIGVLIVVATYIFAVLGLNFFDAYTRSDVDGLLYQDCFSTIGDAYQILFQFLTLDNWWDVTVDLLKISDPTTTWIFVVTWIFLGAFIFRNIFVGVMVSNFSKLRDAMKEEKAEYVKTKRFQRMRQKLNKELKLQRSLQKIAEIQTKNLTLSPSQDHQSEHFKTDVNGNGSFTSAVALSNELPGLALIDSDIDKLNSHPNPPGTVVDKLIIPLQGEPLQPLKSASISLPGTVHDAPPLLESVQNYQTPTITSSSPITNVELSTSIQHPPITVLPSSASSNISNSSPLPTITCNSLLTSSIQEGDNTSHVTSLPNHKPDEPVVIAQKNLFEDTTNRTGLSESPLQSDRPGECVSSLKMPNASTQNDLSVGAPENLNPKLDVANAIEELLRASKGVSDGWDETVVETMQALAGLKVETIWPRDTLFRYFQLMESIQENMKEFEELQLLAQYVLLDIFDK